MLVLRRYKPMLLFLALSVVLFIYNVYYKPKKSQAFVSANRSFIQKSERYQASASAHTNSPQDNIIVSLVICGNERVPQSLNLIKSILLFTKVPVNFVIFTDEATNPIMEGILCKWQAIAPIKYEFHRINLPRKNEVNWLHLFFTCSAQRLFFPSLLPHIDSLIYLDTDTLSLGSITELWSYFAFFNSSQIVATVLEVDENDASKSWYPRHATHPFYGKTGINSGVMLMNLTRMRQFSWEDYVTSIHLIWKKDIKFGDQDILNILFHYHPEALYVLGCRYNYRTDLCDNRVGCNDKLDRGVLILHANRYVFHNNKYPPFYEMYNVFDEHKLGESTLDTLVAGMERQVARLASGACEDVARRAFLLAPRAALAQAPP